MRQFYTGVAVLGIWMGCKSGVRDITGGYCCGMQRGGADNRHALVELPDSAPGRRRQMLRGQQLGFWGSSEAWAQLRRKAGLAGTMSRDRTGYVVSRGKGGGAGDALRHACRV